MAQGQPQHQCLPRKRSSTMGPETESQANAGESHTAKRSRQFADGAGTSTRRSEDAVNSTPQNHSRSPYHSLTRRIASRPGRVARFFEGSMRDLRSQKPPSMYLRENASCQPFSTTQMEDMLDTYMDEQDHAVPERPKTSMSNNRPATSRQTHVRALSHHANASFLEPDPDAAANKEPSGMFRFGKSIAAAFRPRKAWQRPKTNSRNERATSVEVTREERESTATARAREDALAEAREAFEELKRSGAITNFTKTFVRPNAAFQKETPECRDSGIALSPPPHEQRDDQQDVEPETPLAGQPESEEATVEKKEIRKSSFSIRRPSLSEMRRIPSMHNVVHKRSAAPVDATSGSAKADTGEGLGKPESSRPSTEEKADKKRNKLRKRVSKLEAQLEAARQELEISEPNWTVEDAPKVSIEQDLSNDDVFHLSPNPRKTLAMPRRMKSGFIPGNLPSVPSERLLLKPSDGDDRSTWSFKCVGQPETKVAHSDTEAVPEEDVCETGSHGWMRRESWSAPPENSASTCAAGFDILEDEEHLQAQVHRAQAPRKPQDRRNRMAQVESLSRYNSELAPQDFDKENCPTRIKSEQLLTQIAMDAVAPKRTAAVNFSRHHRITRSTTSDDLRRDSQHTLPRPPPRDSSLPRDPSRALPPLPSRAPPPVPLPRPDTRGKPAAAPKTMNFFDDASSDEDKRRPAQQRPPPSSSSSSSSPVHPRSRSRNVLQKRAQPAVQRVDKNASSAGSPARRAKGTSPSKKAEEFEWPEDCF